MNNTIMLVITIVVLIIIFITIFLVISKRKIKEILTPLDVSKEEINEHLKAKYHLYMKITTFIKDNISIPENAFKDFYNFSAKICSGKELIETLDKTTAEINDYVIKYSELLKKEEFVNLRKELYNVQIDLEASIDYYNSKINTYNDLKTNGPTSIASRFFTFDDYEIINNEKKEISSLINLN